MEWSLANSGGTCAVCGRGFDQREEYWSAIYGEAAGFSRKDFCAACWKGPQSEMFSHWRTQSKAKPEPPRRFVDDSMLLDFFERLCESDDPARRKVQFIMGVLLLRKRLLKERSRRRDEGGVVWVVEAPKLARTFEVRDQGLSEAEIAEVLSQMGHVLNVRLTQGA